MFEISGKNPYVEESLARICAQNPYVEESLARICAQNPYVEESLARICAQNLSSVITLSNFEPCIMFSLGVILC